MADENILASLVTAVANGSGHFENAEIDLPPELGAELQYAAKQISQGDTPSNLRPLLFKLAEVYAKDARDYSAYPAGRGKEVLAEWNKKVHELKPRVPAAKLNKTGLMYWEMAIGHLAAAKARMPLSVQLWTAAQFAFQVLSRSIASGAPDPMISILAGVATNAYKIAYINREALLDDLIEIEHGYVCARQDVEISEAESVKAGGQSLSLEDEPENVAQHSVGYEEAGVGGCEWEEPVVPLFQPEPLAINPANGLPMVSPMFDVGGNVFGTDFNH